MAIEIDIPDRPAAIPGPTGLFALIGSDGHIQAVSRSLAAYTGHDSADVVGRHFTDVAVANDLNKVIGRLAEVASGQLDEHTGTMQIANRHTGAFDTFVVCAQPFELGDRTAAIVSMLPAAPPEPTDAALASYLDEFRLSGREREILGLVNEGYRVSTIAKSLFISPSTVRNHLSAIFRKVGVANQAELLERLKQTTA